VNDYDQIKDVLEIILAAVAKELGVPQDNVPNECQSVIIRGSLEIFKRGEAYAHERPTNPPPPAMQYLTRTKTPEPFPAVNSRPRTPSSPMNRVRPDDDEED
jgi:hypothetical protein